MGSIGEHVGQRARHHLLITAVSVLLEFTGSPAEVLAQACFRDTHRGCEAVWITQLGVGWYLRDLGDDEARFLAMVDVGYLAAIDSLNAVGGTLVAGANDVDGWIGLQARYRRWLSTKASLDVGLGAAMPGRSIQAPLITAVLGVNFTESQSVYLQLQPINSRDWRSEEFTGTKLVPSVTFRAGSRLGLILAGSLSALLGAFWASF